jgi:hypothetical protein
MQDQDRGMTLDPAARAAKTPSKPAAISWPFPIDRRLDQLVDIANDAGAGTRRNELAAALMAAASEDAESLLAAVLSYRRANVRDVVLGVPQGTNVIELPRYRPGRRRARG